MPQIPDVDDMLGQVSRVENYLRSIRDRIELSHAELAEQSKQKEEYEKMGYPRHIDRAAPVIVQHEDSKVGAFAGGEPKKRRGVRLSTLG